MSSFLFIFLICIYRRYEIRNELDEIRNNYLVKDITCTFSERSTKYTSNHSKKCFCVVTVFDKRNERSSGKQLTSSYCLSLYNGASSFIQRV